MIGFVNRYVLLAGRTCCAGRSWVGLDRSLARRSGDVPPRSCEPPPFDGSDEPETVTLDTRSPREPVETPVARQ
jgi:hypothetical protein